jgi:hypothetical protein
MADKDSDAAVPVAENGAGADVKDAKESPSVSEKGAAADVKDAKESPSISEKGAAADVKEAKESPSVECLLFECQREFREALRAAKAEHGNDPFGIGFAVTAAVFPSSSSSLKS